MGLKPQVKVTLDRNSHPFHLDMIFPFGQRSYIERLLEDCFCVYHLPAGQEDRDGNVRVRVPLRDYDSAEYREFKLAFNKSSARERKRAKAAEALAQDVLKFIKQRNVFEDVRVYWNNHCECSNKGYIESINPSLYFEYANRETVAVSFEGMMYDYLNYGTGQFGDELQEVFKKHGMYYELGHAWNLSAYER